MKNSAAIGIVLSIVLLAACGAPPSPTPPGPTLTPVYNPTIVAPNGYRPLQHGDEIEGTQIAYQYILPSINQPSVDIAFGVDLLDLISVKPALTDGLVAYARELIQQSHTILGFDENDPNQTAPKQLAIDANKPLEVAFIFLPDGTHNWSVTETDKGEVRTAYKLVRRKDGGLRFIDAYDIVTENSMAFPTMNGSGAGLVYSSRLALLKVILTDPVYQRGENAIAAKPPALSQYDSRILKTDPSQQGLAQDVDWVLIARPGPNPGLISP